MNVQIFFLLVCIRCILPTSDFILKSQRDNTLKSYNFPPWHDDKKLSKILETTIKHPTPIMKKEEKNISPIRRSITDLDKLWYIKNPTQTPIITKEKNKISSNRSIPNLEGEILPQLALKLPQLDLKRCIGLNIANSKQLTPRDISKSSKKNFAIKMSNSRKSTNFIEHADLENKQNVFRNNLENKQNVFRNNLEKEKTTSKSRLPKINNEHYATSLLSNSQKNFAAVNQSFSETKLNLEEEKKTMLPELKEYILTQSNNVIEQHNPEKDVENFVNYVSREVTSVDHEIWTPSKQYRNVKVKEIDDLICGTKISIWKLQSIQIGTRIQNNFGIVILNYQTKIAKTYDMNGNQTNRVFTEVQKIFATSGAFAFLKINGTVELWGYEDVGGRYDRYLTDVTKIIPNKYAFCALTIEHKVRCWGDPKFGGKIGPMFLPPIQKVVATQGAFAALGHNNKIFTWGSKDYVVNGINRDLTSVEFIVSTPGAFAAKQKSDYYIPRFYNVEKEILLWGLEEYFPEAQKKLQKIMKFC